MSRRVTVWFVAALALGLAAGRVSAQTAAPTHEQRAQFKRLVDERNRLHRELTRLDERAADLMKEGGKPVVVHAEQASVQDRLDLVELQLSILAARHGFEVPPLHGRDPAPDGQAPDVEGVPEAKLEEAFARGRERAMKRLREDVHSFLASLDFSTFLKD